MFVQNAILLYFGPHDCDDHVQVFFSRENATFFLYLSFIMVENIVSEICIFPPAWCAWSKIHKKFECFVSFLSDPLTNSMHAWEAENQGYALNFSLRFEECAAVNIQKTFSKKNVSLRGKPSFGSFQIASQRTKKSKKIEICENYVVGLLLKGENSENSKVCQ